MAGNIDPNSLYHLHRHSCSNPSSLHHSFNSKDVKDLQKLKSKLLANSSTSKASIYYTPPEEELLRRSQLNLQTSPIHINYINENLDHRKFELENFKLNQHQFLINTPTQLLDESPTTHNNLDGCARDDTAQALNQLKITPDQPVGSGSIEDNHYASTLADALMASGGKRQRHSAYYEGEKK